MVGVKDDEVVGFGLGEGVIDITGLGAAGRLASDAVDTEFGRQVFNLLPVIFLAT